MSVEFTQANYNFALFTIRNLLDEDSAPGSEKDIRAMEVARFIEDFEMSRASNKMFEPYYVE